VARILVIEDNKDNRELMTYLLQTFGHDVATADDGEEALVTTASRLFDLVICDVNLPKFDGLQVVGILKSRPAFERIPIVAITALAMVGDRERLLGAGFDGYLSKPIEPENFLSQIDQLLKAAPRDEDGDSTSKEAVWRESS
jgi:CheY-like chemotaxis protein